MSTSITTSNDGVRVNHQNEYIPQTSPWNEKRICEFISQDNITAQKTCCSGVKTIDRAIDKAYRNGIQSHLGIRAIQDYPCVTQSEMSKLSNDLENAIKTRGIAMNPPKDLNPSKRPIGISKENLRYCREIVSERLSRELGRISDSKPVAFSKEMLRYCQYALTLRPGNLNPSNYQNKMWDY